MIAPSAVVITKPELTSAFHKQLAAGVTVAVFPASESLRALEAIVARPPKILALDPAFATTARGALLVARVKTDPQLAGIDVRVLAYDGTERPLVLSQRITSVTSPEAALLTASRPLDRCGTRCAVRFPMKLHLEVMVNGDLSQLVNLSATGAQVLAPTRLRPGQSVRITLLNGSAETRFGAVVAWSAAEATKISVLYRAGMEFTDPDPLILTAFCQRQAMSADHASASV